MLDTEFCRTKTCVYKGNNLEKEKNIIFKQASFQHMLAIIFSFLFSICKNIPQHTNTENTPFSRE